MTQRDFEGVFSNALELFLGDHWQNNAPFTSGGEDGVEFSADEIDILKKWAVSNNAEARSVTDKDGTIVIVGDLQYPITNARELVRWNDFFDRMKKKGYVEVNRYNRRGDRVYRLLVPAYDYIDSFDKQ